MEFMISWPQGILLTIYILGLIIAAHEHGKPRNPGNFWPQFIGTLVAIGLLYWGGFFG